MIVKPLVERNELALTSIVISFRRSKPSAHSRSTIRANIGTRINKPRMNRKIVRA
jgi:hypothetical protein